MDESDPDQASRKIPDQPSAGTRAESPEWLRRATASPATSARPQSVSPKREGQNGKTRKRQAILWVSVTVAVVALLLALLSLAANGLLIRELLATRDEGRQLVDGVIAGLDEAAMGEVSFSYVFSDTIVYTGTVPISQTILFPFEGTVPFQGSVPFQGVVPVVINIPVLGPQRFNVPVDTSVYVDTAVDVSTTVTVPIELTFPFEVEMPIQMPIDVAFSMDDQPALRDTLAGVRAFLVELRTRILQ